MPWLYSTGYRKADISCLRTSLGVIGLGFVGPYLVECSRFVSINNTLSVGEHSTHPQSADTSIHTHTQLKVQDVQGSEAEVWLELRYGRPLGGGKHPRGEARSGYFL